ncbi:hypothetical protein [Paracoccus marcusii]|uniref:hypothetical protein n=1 Tax=Paracoccus marcusii TaxID=59779 RepID=UPI003735D3FD
MAKSQQTFADMLEEMEALKRRIADEADSRVKEIKEELDAIAEAKGISIGQLLGLPEAKTATVSTDTSTSTATKGPSPTTRIRKQYAGRTVLAGQNNKGQSDYDIKSDGKGAAPGWVIELFAEGRLEEFLSDVEEAPSVVTPKDEKTA